MECKLNTGYDFIVVKDIDVIDDFIALSDMWRKHSIAITSIDNLGTMEDGRMRDIHVHIRNIIFKPYVMHLIRKYIG